MIWLLAALMMASVATAQPEIAWTQEYGQNGVDYCYGIYVLEDGSIVIGGDTWTDINNNRNTNLYIIKLNEDGEEIWYNLYGDEDTQVSGSFIQTSDGGFSFAGGSTNGRGIIENRRPNRDDYEGPVFIVKIDSDGEEEWSQSYEGTIYCRDHVQTEDGGFALVGSDIWDDSYFLKTDSEGGLEWDRVFESYDEYYYSMYSLTYLGYNERNDRDVFIVSGSKYNADDHNLIIDRLDNHGLRNWLELGGEFNVGIVINIYPTEDEGYLCFGRGSVMKLNEWGTIQWMRRIETELDPDRYDIVKNSEGNFIIAGTYHGNEGDMLYLSKISFEGELIWEQYYDIQIWYPYLDIAPDGSIVIAGSVNTEDNSGDLIVIKTEPDEVYVRDEALNLPANKFIIDAAYPNPFNSTVTLSYLQSISGDIRISVHDNFGREVEMLRNGFQSAGKHIINWMPKHIPSGNFIVSVNMAGKSSMIPVTLVK